MKYFLQNSSVLCLLFGFLLFFGCAEPDKNIKAQYIIQTQKLNISKIEFAEELELKRSAYPYDIKKDPKEYNEMVISLVKALTEEIVLLTAAVDKQIFITDQEVLSAQKEFKKDYPEDSFEQILLENAISYPLWEKRFKKNMIMEKLIDQELKQKIEITPQDIVQFYKIYQRTPFGSEKNPNGLEEIVNENELIAKLRTQKTEENYYGWIQELHKTYPVEINKELLKYFLIDLNTDKEYANAKEN